MVFFLYDYIYIEDMYLCMERSKVQNSRTVKQEANMLTLRDIKKEYRVGDMTIPALKGVSIQFRKSEFVSVLGQSGCGKTTLLNIIGGLDQYTEGDLIINGVSTKKFKDSDWDSYRNHSIGFVFQNYNLIPHQSILANVELALTISGVNKTTRRKNKTRKFKCRNYYKGRLSKNVRIFKNTKFF